MKRKKTRKPHKRAKKAKAYDSMESAAIALETSRDVLKRAKIAGCPAFRSNRVYGDEFRKWLAAPGNAAKMIEASASAVLHDSKTNEEIRKLKIKNDRDDRSLIPRTKVVEAFTVFAREARLLLDRKLGDEWPVAVVGMDVAQAQVYGRRLNASIVAELRKLCDTWNF